METEIFTLNIQASLSMLRDAICERSDQLSALTHVALNDEFSDYPKQTIYHYLSLINNYIEDLKKLLHEIFQRIPVG